MEKRARSGGLVVTARGALPGIGSAPGARVAVTALAASEAIAPFKLRKVRKTALGIRKTLPELEKREALESLLHVLSLSLP